MQDNPFAPYTSKNEIKPEDISSIPQLDFSAASHADAEEPSENQPEEMTTPFQQDSASSQSGTSAATQIPVPPMRNGYPAKLWDVDKGRVVAELKRLRENCKVTSPNEIYRILNPSEIAEAAEAQFSQNTHTLEGWRNGLILVPIMITWISLGLAGLAYTQSITANSKLIAEPLLQQWAQGFTALKYVSINNVHVPMVFGQWRYFSFGDVAVFDFILFVFLLILTVISQSIEAKAARDANDLGTWLREECAILSANSSARILGQGPGGDAPEWAVLVNTSIENLQGVMSDATTLIRSFDEVLKDDRESVSKALTAVDNLNAIYESGRVTYEKLDAILLEMNTSLRTMTDSQAESVRSLDKIATAVNNSSDAVVQLTQPFATVNMGQLAKETFSTLQQTQFRQQQISDELAQQLSLLGRMKSSPKKPVVYRWWDVRRFFPFWYRK
jgi:methyl-accepting chemotaxis protein